MSAQDVWNCLQKYTPHQAKRLERRYGNGNAVIAQLESYPGKDKYHGHCKGQPGDASNPGAETNRAAALKFLSKNAPTNPSETKQKGPDKALKKASEEATDLLIEIINTENNFADLAAALDAEAKGWRDNRIVWNAYSIKYKAKKGKDPTKVQ
jgi:hypothetical protein